MLTLTLLTLIAPFLAAAVLHGLLGRAQSRWERRAEVAADARRVSAETHVAQSDVPHGHQADVAHEHQAA
jgi:hypothetical protein